MRLALLALLAVVAPVAAGAGTLLVDPDDPGPDIAAGRSTLDDVLVDGIPYPFEALLGRIEAEAGKGNVTTALIPLGRSSQRIAAHPDFFGSPRIVAAATGGLASGPAAPHLADRLFLAYQPAEATVLAISWNDEAGRFEFQQIDDYAEGATPRIASVERAACVACHQAEGPAFPRAPWSETNAQPLIARRLAGLGTAFHGAPVAGSVDAMAAFGIAVERAGALAVANRLWSQGCEGPACRAALLNDALRFGMNGMRPDWRPAGGQAAESFAERVADLWPEGLEAPPVLLPDRDPIRTLGHLAPAALSAGLLRGEGEANPRARHDPVPLWRPGAESWNDAARAVAGLLAPGDFVWLDGLLATASGQEPVEARAECAAEIVARDGGRELRFDCEGGGDGHGDGDGDGLHLAGFLAGGEAGIRGRVERFRLGEAGGFGRFPVAASEEDGALRVFFAGQSPRIDDGRRLDGLTIRRTGEGAEATIAIVDDFAPLAGRLRDMARVGDPVFGDGPFRRGAILDALERALDPGDG